MTAKILKIGAAVCFGLATFGVAVSTIQLLPLGLLLYVIAELI